MILVGKSETGAIYITDEPDGFPTNLIDSYVELADNPTMPTRSEMRWLYGLLEAIARFTHDDITVNTDNQFVEFT